jgi:hypothetical protein
MKLKCKEHNRRVVAFERVIVHRSDNTHCDNPLQIGHHTVLATFRGLVEWFGVDEKGRDVETLIQHPTSQEIDNGATPTRW